MRVYNNPDSFHFLITNSLYIMKQAGGKVKPGCHLHNLLRKLSVLWKLLIFLSLNVHANASLRRKFHRHLRKWNPLIHKGINQGISALYLAFSPLSFLPLYDGGPHIFMCLSLGLWHCCLSIASWLSSVADDVIGYRIDYGVG